MNDIVVGFPMGSKGYLPLALREVTSLIFPSPSPNSPSWPANSSVFSGTIEGGFRLPCLILVLFLLLNYKGSCLEHHLLGLTGLLTMAKLTPTSCFLFFGERFICFPYFPLFWDLQSSSVVSYSTLCSPSSSYFLPLALYFGISSCFIELRACVSMKTSISMSTKSAHNTGILRWLKEFMTMSLMTPWWALC